MVDIIGYSGNAGLGLGSNPNIPVSASPDSLDILNQTARDLAQWSNERDAILFDQKIKDRNILINMVANDKISTGGILPEYLPEIEKAKNIAIEKFKNWKGNLNDIKGAMEYKQAFNKALDLSKIAQVNTTGIQEIRKLKSQEPIKYRQADYDKFEKNQLAKGLNDIVSPYQKSMYLDVDGLVTDLNQSVYDMPGAVSQPTDVTQKSTVTDKGGKVSTTKTTTTKLGNEKKPVNVSRGTSGEISITSKQPDKIVNYDNILGRAGMRFFERGKEAEQQELLIKGIQEAPVSESRKFIESVNDRIRIYNEQTKGKSTPVKELKEGQDFYEYTNPQTGEKQLLISTRTPEFAAKVSLAKHSGNYFEEGAEVFNKEAADFWLKNQKLKLDAAKLGLDREKARAYMDYTAQKVKQLKGEGIDSDKVKLISDRWQANPVLSDVSAPAWTFDAMAAKSGGSGLIFDVTDIPTNFRNVLIVTDPRSKKQVNRAPDLFVDPSTGRQYLKGEIILSDGSKIDLSRKGIEKALNEQKKLGKVRQSVTVDDAMRVMENKVKEGLSTGVYKSLMRDKSGNVIDVNSISDAYRIINNSTASKKGQDPLFIEREDETEE